MTFFAVDDDVESSPKFEALDALPHARRSAAWEAWTRLGAACQKRGNGGAIPRALLAKILHAWTPAARERAALDLVEARGNREHGLWTAASDIDGWRFHGWIGWNHSQEEAAAKRSKRDSKNAYQRAWRAGDAGTKNAPPPPTGPPRVGDSETPTPAPQESATEVPTNDSPRESRDESSPRARSPARAIPVPSRPVPSEGEREPTLSPEGSAWTRAYGRAFERATGGPASSILHLLPALIESRADPERAVAGFFATERMGKTRPPWQARILAEDPCGYAACAPVEVSPVDPEEAHKRARARVAEANAEWARRAGA